VEGLSSVFASLRTVQQNDTQLGEVFKAHERMAARLPQGQVEVGRMGYVFGPVTSARLGGRLGIDPVLYKTCSWNCLYCRLAGTALQTAELEKELSRCIRIMDECPTRRPTS
jgi:hypothetical protein